MQMSSWTIYAVLLNFLVLQSRQGDESFFAINSFRPLERQADHKLSTRYKNSIQSASDYMPDTLNIIYVDKKSQGPSRWGHIKGSVPMGLSWSVSMKC